MPDRTTESGCGARAAARRPCTRARPARSSASASAASCWPGSGWSCCSTPGLDVRRARPLRAAPQPELQDDGEPAPTATAWSPATAPSTAAGCSCSRRTSPSSAGRWARRSREKICKVMDMALRYRLPGRSASTTPAARASRRASSRSPATPTSSSATSQASGVIPQISLVMGPCAGGAVYSPAITDFVLMVRGDLAHVHHRPRGGEDGDRRGRVSSRSWAAPHAHATRSPASPTSPRPTSADCIEDCRYLLVVPAPATTASRRRGSRRPIRPTARTPSSTR